MGWVWVYVDENGTAVEALSASAVVSEFPTQAEAEAYIGGSWQELLDAGVDQVSLYEGDRLVYGPMSLHPA